MPRARVYRNLARRQELWGLEPVDVLALAGVLWVLLTFHRGQLALNGLCMAVLYVALRLAKRGRPPGFTTDALRYAFSRRVFLSAAEPDREGRAHTHRALAYDDPGLAPFPLAQEIDRP
jgi:hypothetical protein